MAGFTQKILEGFGTLLEKVSADDEPLHGIDAAALNAELEARAALREKTGARPPADNPRAALAGPGEELRARRAKLAAEREARIRGERERREAAARRQKEEAFRRMAEEARRQAEADAQARARAAAGARTGASSGRTSSGYGGSRPGAGRPGAGARARSAFAGGGRRSEVASAYRTLDLPEGADFAQVKAAYRKLMRRYHPDLHGDSPKKQKAATELSVQVTQAYNLLEKHLQGR